MSITNGVTNEQFFPPIQNKNLHRLPCSFLTSSEFYPSKYHGLTASPPIPIDHHFAPIIIQSQHMKTKEKAEYNVQHKDIL